MSYQPGESGNLNGRPIGKNPATLAKSHSGAAIGALSEICNNKNATIAARLKASEIILNLAAGKPLQATESLGVIS